MRPAPAALSALCGEVPERKEAASKARDYDGQMGLSLVVGPAHAGKVALLLDRFVDALDRDPWLIVPNRVDVDRVERELAGRKGALLAGTVGTFDTLFSFLAGPGPAPRVLGEAERTIVLRQLVAAAPPDRSGRRRALPASPIARRCADRDRGEPPRSARSRSRAGRADAAYRAELARLGVARSRHAAAPCGRAADDGARLVERGAGVRVRVRGPDRRGVAPDRGARGPRGGACLAPVRARSRGVRVAAAHVRRPLARSRAATSSSSSRAPARYLPHGLAHLERHLFDDDPRRSPLDSSIRFLEGAGRRATLELVAETMLELVRDGLAPEEIAVVCPSLDRSRASIETAFGSLGVPIAIEAGRGSATTAFGQALLSLLRFAWSNGTRRELYAFLRTPYGGLAPPGRRLPRGPAARARSAPRRPHARGDDEAAHRPPAADARAPRIRGGAARAPPGRRWRCSATRTASAPPPATPAAKRDLRAADAATRGARRAGTAARGRRRRSTRTTCSRLSIGRRSAAMRPASRAVSRCSTWRTCPDAQLRGGVRDRPRAGIAAAPGSHVSVFRRRDAHASSTAREAHGSQRPDAASRDRYLFYTACTRPRKLLTLVREAATDDGSPREASPFWEAVCGLFDADDVRRHTTRRPLARLTWPIESAPTERERLRALARLAAGDPREADALAYANGWQRKLGRARRAFTRPTAIRHPRAVALLGSRETFRVTDLERMAGCSSAWFVERYLRPGEIDQAIDPMMRGSIAHVALQRFYRQLPAEIPGAERVTPDNVEAAVALMHRCVDGALDSGLRIDVDDLQRRELGQGLQRDLEQLVRAEAAASSTFVPRKLEVVVQGLRARARRRGRRQDRSRRRRSAQRAWDRRRLQVRRGAVGNADPRRGAAADPALSARAARPARARADGRRLHAARRRPPAARDAARRRGAGAGLRRRRLSRRDGVRGRDRARARRRGRARRAHPRRGRPARPARRRLPGLVRPLAHVPQGAA